MSTAIPFKRGGTFSFLFNVPDDIEDNFFETWTLSSQLRKRGSNTDVGLIAQLAPFWADPTTHRVICAYHNETSEWPLGMAEMDIMFTSTDGQTVISNTICIDIQREITR